MKCGRIVVPSDVADGLSRGDIMYYSDGINPYVKLATLTGTPSADSQYSNYAPAQAFDGNTATDWASAISDFPHWIKYDFGVGASNAVTKIRVYGYGIYLKDFTIQGSNDDSSYSTIYTGVSPNTAGWLSFTFANTTGYRYWLMNCTTAYSGTQIQFSELEFYTGGTVGNAGWQRLPIGTSGQTLKVSDSGLPAWTT